MDNQTKSLAVELRLQFWRMVAGLADLALRYKSAIRFAYPILVLLAAGTLAYFLGLAVGGFLIGPSF
ncbi:MAG: hypothetical protein PVF70_10065 [Anaerolineales bacterium]|jgi:hypothetical protein